MVVNTYGISVGIEKIGWKLYLVYIGWICVELVIIYFVSCFFFFFSFLFFGGLRLGLFTRTLLPLLRTMRTTNWVPRNDTHANTFFFSHLQFFVETAGKTLEELKQIFEAPNPRKASTRKTKVAMAEGGQVVHVD